MTEHKNIYSAMAAAQADMGPVVKGSINPHFKSKYADLADIMSVAVPALTKHGVYIWHSFVYEDGQKCMRTTASHGASDTHLHCDVPLIVQKNDMQGMKSATTYAKRIGAESLTGIAPEDDDGNAAAKAAPKDEPAQPPVADDRAVQEAIDYLSTAGSLADLRNRWGNLPKHVQAAPAVIAAKNGARDAFENAACAKPITQDEIPY